MAHGRFLDPVHRQGNLVSIYDPFSTKADGSRTPIPGNRIPTNQIDPVAAKLLSFWKRGMIKEALAFALGARAVGSGARPANAGEGGMSCARSPGSSGGMMVGVTSAQPPRLSQEWLVVAQRALQAEANAIQAAAVRLDGNISEAVRLIVGHAGKIVVTGVGKSGLIGQKLSATLCSTGTPAVFLHAADAVHGDLGVYAPGDPTIMISKSGATAELTRLLPFLRSMRSPLIGILGNLNSPLALAAEVVLDASIDQEADPHNLAPTTSAVVAMALGDALAVALMQARGFSVEEFCLCHPSGQLGRNLALQVRDVMHAWPNVAWVEPAAPMKEVVVAMTRYPLGAACVAAPDGQLAGLITDGDLRRALQIYDDIRPLRAEDIMTRRPVTTDPDAQLCEALRLMENRPSQISVLVVVDPCNGRCLGLLRVHDIYQEPSGQCDRRS